MQILILLLQFKYRNMFIQTNDDGATGHYTTEIIKKRPSVIAASLASAVDKLTTASHRGARHFNSIYVRTPNLIADEY